MCFDKMKSTGDILNRIEQGEQKAMYGHGQMIRFVECFNVAWFLDKVVYELTEK
jgi:hypothetical protein